MKTAQIIHNPTAGDAAHDKKDLMEFAEASGFRGLYTSTEDEDWEDFLENDFDVIILAGGDGTVHKLASTLLKRGRTTGNQPPIRLLPLGTANNIASTLGLSTHKKPKLDLKGTIKKYDCGRVKGLNDEDLFFESIGFGIFPELITEMEKRESNDAEPEEKLHTTLKVLLEIVRKSSARKARLEFDGMEITGSFLMVELMNIKYVGPLLKLAPHAEPGDGFFDLVMIPEKCKAQLEEYLEKKITNREDAMELPDFVRSMRVRKGRMQWEGATVHLDDDFIPDYSGETFTVEILPGALNFLQENQEL